LPTGPTSLYDLADDLLQAAKASLATPPSAVFVSIGDPPYDGCELLTVHLLELGTAQTMRTSVMTGGTAQWHHEHSGTVNIVHLVITILRCVSAPQGGIRISVPAAAKMNSEAASAYEDAWRIWNGIRTALADGNLWTGFPCREIAFGPVTPVPPQGLGAGSTIEVAVALDGYDQ
jgi:hypothetical protein